MLDYVYDVEDFPNVFTLTINQGEQWWVFEISHRRNDIDLIIQMVNAIKYHNDRMVGFNNISYDYPVLHFIIQNRPTPSQIYEKSTSIIETPFNQRFNHIIWDRDQYADQIDLLKIHHFDNVSKFTGLKMLEFNMRSKNIEDLPFPPGTVLTDDQIDTLIRYNIHDVKETGKFLEESRDMIQFREELSMKYDRNFLNDNDTKIGEQIFIMRLNDAGVATRTPDRKPTQTPRPAIRLGDVILPYVCFKNPEFERIRQWLAAQTITETKGVFKDLSCTINGFQFDFGVGGIHGSVESQTVYTDTGGVVVDLDVTSYYPSLAIVNKLFPEHLGSTFCDIYADMKQQRIKYAKGTGENQALKLALNGSYGKSNSPYSSFYDPQFTMAITINGQLLLCMLSEYLMNIPGLKIIQINTDGVTVKCPQSQVAALQRVAAMWENLTGLDLESAVYSRMFIRDVNNYLAEYKDGGKIKYKGAYAYKLGWHQNHSALVIPRAAGEALVHGVSVEEFVYNHPDPMDFLLRTKVPRNSYLLHGDEQVQNITRYYISTTGESLTKVMPPLKKNPTKWRRIGINKGYKTTVCNHWNGILAGINYDYYIKEARKLVDPLR